MVILKSILLKLRETLVSKCPLCAILSFASAFIFYYPLLRNKCRDAGILFSGDTLGYYWPMIIKTHSLFAIHKFSAIDFSLFNGSSEFFLNANFFYFHPLLVAFGLLVPFGENCITYAGQFLVFLLFAHSFLSIYCLTKICRVYLGFCTSLSLLGGIFYTFSVYMVNSLNQPPFLLCATMTPCITYAVLKATDSGRLNDLLFASLPVFICLLGGYLPLAAMCIAISLLFYILIIYNNEKKFDIQRITRLLVPYLIAGFFFLPYALAVKVFHQNTTSDSVISLFYSAHQLADIPANFINILSNRLGLSTKTNEFTVSLGLIPVWVLAMWLFDSKDKNKIISIKTGFVSACLIIPIFICLSTFGDFSPLSDILYYFVPILGKMHIYQRYYLPAFIFITIVVLFAMCSVIESRNTFLKKVGFLLSLIFLIVITYSNLTSFKIVGININGFLVMEALCLFFFCLLLLVGHKKSTLMLGLFLIMIPRLDQVYDLALGANTFEKASERSPFALNSKKLQEIKNLFETYFGTKALRYADLTNFWSPQGVEPFPKTFPYLLLYNYKLTSLGGFCFYLGCDKNYQNLVPYQASLTGDLAIPDNVQYYLDSKIDFIIGKSGNLKEFPVGIKETIPLSESIDLGIMQNEKTGQDIKIDPENYKSRVLNVFKFTNSQNQAAYKNHATNAFVRQSSEGGGVAKNAIDGITDGSFSKNSVTHTAKQKYPYLELDLHKVEKISEIEIWNRTDGASERLKDYIVVVSSAPIPDADNFTKMTSRPGTYLVKGIFPRPVAKLKMPEDCFGRFVRIQITSTEETWLSVAEVKVLEKSVSDSSPQGNILIENFFFDFSSKIDLTFSSTHSGVLSYQFFPNKNLKFFLNGKRIKPTIENGFATLSYAAGKNMVVMKYNNVLMSVFVSLYFLYFTLLALSMTHKLLKAKV